MTFEKIIYATEVAKCGSINKAAKKLFVSASAVSLAIKELEEELSIVLFERTNKGVKITVKGQQIIGYLLSIREKLNRLEEVCGISGDCPRDCIFSVSSEHLSFVNHALVHLLDSLDSKKYSIKYRAASTDEVIEDIYTHKSDIGIITIQTYAEELIHSLLKQKNICFVKIASATPCIFCRKGHPLANRNSVNERDLVSFPYIYYEYAENSAMEFQENYQIISELVHPQTICTNNSSTMIRLLENTNAFSTGSGIRSLLETNQTISVPIEDLSPIDVGYILPKNASISPITEEFVALLKDAINTSSYFPKGEEKT